MKFLTYDVDMDRTAMFLERFPDGGVLEIGYGILSSPVLAFRFAQVWERAKMEGVDPFDERGRRRFASSLLSWTRLGGLQEPLVLLQEESSLKVLDSYLEAVSRLLKQWRACNQNPVRWWMSNAEEVLLLEAAVASIGFNLRCVKSSLDMQPRLPWGSRNVESFFPVKKPKRVSDVWDHFAKERNAPLRVVKSMPFLREEHSLIEAARKMAYLLFSEVLVQGLRVQFCLRCGAAFLFGKKQKYCSKQCGHIDSGKQSKSRTEPRKNRDRVRVASQAIVAWIDRGGKRDWRGSAEKKLSETKIKSNKKGTKDEYLIAPSSNKSQWLGRCIRAAGSLDDSPKRARLTDLCTGPGPSEEERKEVLKDLNAFYDLIRQAQDRERSFKAKRATAPAANAAHRPAAVPR